MENARLSRDKFQYYDKKNLQNRSGYWYVNNRKLNIYSAIDFAYSTAVKADYTCIIVIGMDYDGNVYVLDIDRFKTNKNETYFQAIFDMCNKWEFTKIRAEVTAAQETIAEYIQDRAKDLGMSLKVDKTRPTRHQGSKEERIAAALEPRYENLEVYHFKGGYTDMLEEELLKSNTKHDDLKDCLASAVTGDIKRPRAPRQEYQEQVVELRAHPRFGGVAF
jgi:phage terminase large subunit-like protein